MSVTVIENHAEEIKREMKERLERAVSKVGGTCMNYAKKNCPVKTGYLRRSITHQTTKDGDNIVEEIGTNVEYAPYVELGHHQEPGRYVPAIGKRLVRDWVPPKPYLKPAFEDHQDEYAQILKSELEG